MLLSSLNEFIRDTKQCKHHCCHWKPLLEAVMSYNICFSSSLVTTERVAASLLLPLPVWFYAFDPRRTSRFTFLAFRPQSLLGYLLSPPALSTIISQQERSAAARPGGGRWDTFDSKRTHGNSGITLIFFFYLRGREQRFFMMMRAWAGKKSVSFCLCHKRKKKTSAKTNKAHTLYLPFETPDRAACFWWN